MGINTIANHLAYEPQKEINPAQGQPKHPTTASAADTPPSTVPHDEYISSKNTPEQPSGLYRMVPDENGNPKVLYDDPKKTNAKEAQGDETDMPEKVPDENPDSKSEECTMNTDRVDREIKKLREEQKQLKQQLQSAAGDDKKAKQLERKLANVENQLRQKDNDTYRQQNASIS